MIEHLVFSFCIKWLMEKRRCFYSSKAGTDGRFTPTPIFLSLPFFLPIVKLSSGFAGKVDYII